VPTAQSRLVYKFTAIIVLILIRVAVPRLPRSHK